MKMKRFACVLMAALLMMVAACSLAMDEESAKQGVVRMYTEFDLSLVNEASGYTLTVIDDQPYGTGSGFAVGKKGEPVKYFVTNEHVVGSEKEIEELFAENKEIKEYLDDGLKLKVSLSRYVVLTDINAKIPVEIVRIDDRADLAIVQMMEATDKRVPLAIRPFEKKELSKNNTVFALGFPGAVDDVLNNNDKLYSGTERVSKTMGNVSSVMDTATTGGQGEQIQINVTVLPGNSGGPLVDEKGYVLGVNTRGLTTADINWAVSANEVVRLLDAEKIPYFTSYGLSTTHIALIVLGVLIVLVIVLIVLQTKGKKPSKADPKKNDGKAPTDPSAVRHLVFETGALAGRRFRLERKLVIGRDRKKCDVVFPNETAGVSGVHCTLRFDGKTVTITDHSSNGTIIGGQKIAKDKPVVIHRGQQVQLGSDKQSFTLRA